MVGIISYHTVGGLIQYLKPRLACQLFLGFTESPFLFFLVYQTRIVVLRAYCLDSADFISTLELCYQHL